jgi:sulfoxide reductase heme-binding subunit YedZ
VLVGAALLAGLLTAGIETTWYALTSGVSARLVFEANADILTYQDFASIRPAHWVALAGLAVALVHGLRARAPRPPRRAREPATA